MSWLDAAIAGGAALVGSAGNWISSGKLNKRAENYNKWMYRHQRIDALADRDFALEYQSPQAQMQRLQAAGLNPNLMYGSGVQAQSAPDVRASRMSMPNYKQPTLDFGGVAQSALQGMQARANISLTEAQAEQVRTNTAQGKFDLAVKQGVGLEDMVDTAKRKLASEGAQYKQEYFKAEVMLNALMTNSDTGKLEDLYSKDHNFRKVVDAGFKEVQVKLKNLQKDGQIKEAIRVVKDFEADLAKNGISPNSPWFVKALMALLENSLGDSARSLLIGQ